MSRDLEKESIQVTIRVRPLSQKQLHEDSRCCIKPENGPQRLTLVNGNQSKSFAFDSVVGIEEGQQDIFEKVGLNSTTHCLEGYNCSIFAYGQTGSGKTFTMMGVGQQDPKAVEKRGLVPRTLEHLFECIDKETEQSRTEYLVKCTFLQIYNETIIDLLDKNNSNLQIRQDLKKGVYVEGVYEETISKAEEALELLRRGSKGRHVGSTYYNQTSSRSHSVFTLLLQSKFTKNGVVNVKVRRFHFIDLAGSERTRHSNGERLKEGCSINKSLHVLGMVINSLVQATEGKAKHVNYRDSKLTFLLKDALGGNSKTHLIANISPGLIAYQQTLSTLNFARRVKLIKLNKALINEDASGNLDALKSEIIRLKQEIMVLRSHPTSSLVVKQIDSNGISSPSSELERVFLKSDGHLGLEKLLKDYIEESIEKETRFQVELLKREEKIDKLYEAIKEYSKNEIHLRMIVEIYQKRFVRMKYFQGKLKDLSSSDPEEQNKFFQEEKQALNAQVVELRQLLKQTPFLKSLIKQNNILREEIRNPQELAHIIGANMQFLTELKQQLNYGIKEREELNDIIQHYAMAKSTKDMMSPRKQKELEEELESKQKQYQDNIEQLGLEIAFLKATSEQSEILLKQAVQREMELQEKISVLQGKAEQGQINKQRNKELERQLEQTRIRQEQLDKKVQNMTLEIISAKQSINDKSEQLVEERQSHAALKQELSQSVEATTILIKQFQEKIQTLQKQLRSSEQEYQSLNILFEETQTTLEVQKRGKQKTIEIKNQQINILQERIGAVEMQNIDYATLIDSLKLQIQTHSNLHQKHSQQLSAKIDKITKQLEGQRIENKKRQEQLEVRWTNQKVNNEDEANKRIKDLNMQLISEENKFSEAKLNYQRALEELNQRNTESSNKIEQLNRNISEQKRQKEQLKTKESELLAGLKQTNESMKQLELSFGLKQEQMSQTINNLKATVSSLQAKNKELQSSLSSLQQSSISLKQDIERKEKQVQRLKDSHLKQIEMIKSQGVEYKQRTAAHELSMKQIFDECLKNKDKVMNQLKQQQSIQLIEEKRQLDESKQQTKVVQSQLKKLQDELAKAESDRESKETQIQKLTDLLNKEIDQSQSKAEERQIAHNEFIDRKNSEIESLEHAIQVLQNQLSEKQQHIETKSDQLNQIFELLRIENKGESNTQMMIEQIKTKFVEGQKAKDELGEVNHQLQIQLREFSVKQIQKNEEIALLHNQITTYQNDIAELKQKVGDVTEFSEQLVKSSLENLNSLNVAKDNISQLNIFVQQKQSKIDQLQTIIQSLKSQSEKLNSEIHQSKQNLEQKQKQIETMKSKAQDLKTQIGSSIAEAENIQRMFQQYKLTIVNKDCKIDQMKMNWEDAQRKLSVLQREKCQADENKLKMKESNISMSQELAKRQTELKQLYEYREKYLQTDSQLKQALSMNYELNKNVAVLEKSTLDYEASIMSLNQELEQARKQYTIEHQKVLQVSEQLLEVNKTSQQQTVFSHKNEQIIIKQQQYTKQLQQKILEERHINEQLEQKLCILEQTNKQLSEMQSQSSHQYLARLNTLEKQKRSIEEQLSHERQVVLSKLKAMEEMELRSTEERHQQLENAKQDFLNELRIERMNFQQDKSRLEKEVSHLCDNRKSLQQTSRALQQANTKLTQSNFDLHSNVKVLNDEITKQCEKSIGLKRLIDNLERQKQQLQKQLEDKEMSYKRLLSKICKEDESRKASEDKKTIMKTNQLLEKSRLQLLQYKKASDENVKLIKKLKAEMQMKQQHYITVHQKAEEYCKSQQAKLSEVKTNYGRLEQDNVALLNELKQSYNLKDQVHSLRQQLQGYRGYKQKSEKRREDLQLTIKSLSDELQRVRKDEKVGFNKGQDEKMLFINKLKQENGLIKRQKFTLTEEMTRLKRQNQILLDKLADESEQKLRLKQMYERKTLKQSGRGDVIAPDVASKIELQRKQAEIRYLQEGYAQLCTILNIKKLSEPKNRGESTLGLIKNVVEGLTEEVSALRCALKQRQRQLESKNTKMEVINREYNHYKSKDYKRGISDYNPIKNALEETNKIVGDEYNSFENLKNRALELKEQSKLKKDRY